jgi:hypothetical protein
MGLVLVDHLYSGFLLAHSMQEMTFLFSILNPMFASSYTSCNDSLSLMRPAGDTSRSWISSKQSGQWFIISRCAIEKAMGGSDVISEYFGVGVPSRSKERHRSRSALVQGIGVGVSMDRASVFLLRVSSHIESVVTPFEQRKG